MSYTGADWALACGRWATRYLNGLSFNIIMPGVWVLFYMLCVFANAVVLVKMWNIRGGASVCLLSFILAVNPAVIEQSLLQYMFLAWGLSNLFSLIFVYISISSESRLARYMLAPLLMALAFGFYQASVGTICMAFCAALIIRLLSGTELRKIIITVLRFLLSSMIGLLLYFAVFKYELGRYVVEESGRVQEFSVSKILGSLGETIPQAYSSFYNFFSDYFFYRKSLYMLMFGLVLAFFAFRLTKLIREKRFAGAGAAVTLFCLLPLAANITKVIFPDTEIKTLMQYQNVFVVPFLFSLAEMEGPERNGFINAGRCLSCLLLASLCWGYTVSANATYSVYELSYRHMNFMTGSILNRVYSMPEYSEGDTIVFAGFVDDSELRANVTAYKFAYGQYDNLVYWMDAGTGLRQSRNNYLLNYFGFSGGYIRGTMHGDYNSAVTSPEFMDMGIYPEENSIKKFGNMIIVKLTEQPPLFD